MEFRNPCPQCGSRDTRFTNPKPLDHILRWFLGEFLIYRCRLCRARFRKRVPKERPHTVTS